MMDVHCATCGEPWDTYHIRHDAVYETPAGLDWLNHQINMEDWDKEMCKFGGLSRTAALKACPAPEPPAHEKWEGKLTAFWREQFKLDGWEFGVSLNAVLRCPCCKDAELPDAEERRARVQVLSEVYAGDDDAIAADNELALKFNDA
jgi:hypothetical protein